MGNLPVLKPAEVVAILAKMGFSEVRQRGSHKQFRDSSGRATTVPFHQERDISPILLRQICRDIGVAVDEFLLAGAMPAGLRPTSVVWGIGLQTVVLLKARGTSAHTI